MEGPVFQIKSSDFMPKIGEFETLLKGVELLEPC